jgi:hypothetical protein
MNAVSLRKLLSISAVIRRGASNSHGFPHPPLKLPNQAACIFIHATYRFIQFES